FPGKTARIVRYPRYPPAHRRPVGTTLRRSTTMEWAELTGDEFAGAVEQCGGVCLVPLSVIERHGHHLPLGTDMYIGRELCRRAAALEPALVFPDNPFTQI